MTMRGRIHAPAEFLRTEASAGRLLLAAGTLALVWANLPGDSYRDLWSRELTLGFGRAAVTESIRDWVNDGLMTLFFFLAGLEIKRELVTGELRDRRAALLPVAGALGGMIVPALLYLAVAPAGEAGRGWGIPMATDIAFAVGVVTLLGSRVPSGVRLFLLTLAIADDIGAIVVIAFFYAEGLSGWWILGAIAGLAVVAALRASGVSHPAAVVIPGVAVWFATLQSGIHPAIAGVTLGLLTRATPAGGRAVLEDLETRLHPWVSFGIVPLFALANAGVVLSAGGIRDALQSRVTGGIVLGLVLGKTVGITGAVALALRVRAGRLPAGMTMRHVAGAAALGGIGFTVSLFMTTLAFESARFIDQAKIGIIAGSLAAGILGFLLLARASRDPAA